MRHRRWWLCCRWWRRHGLVPVFARPLPVAHGRVTPDADGVATLSQSPPKTCSRIEYAQEAPFPFSKEEPTPRLLPSFEIRVSLFVAQSHARFSRIERGARTRVEIADVLDFDHVDYTLFVVVKVLFVRERIPPVDNRQGRCWINELLTCRFALVDIPVYGIARVNASFVGGVFFFFFGATLFVLASVSTSMRIIYDRLRSIEAHITR